MERIAIVPNGRQETVIQFLSKMYVCTFLRFSLAQILEDSCTLVSSRDFKPHLHLQVFLGTVNGKISQVFP